MLLTCVLALVGFGVIAADAIETRSLQFAKGASSTSVRGSLKGDKTIDYKLRAKAGQTMSVSLKTSNSANYFNVLPPDSAEVAIFVGSTSGNEWTGSLPADGEYSIRVYLMRSAARRNETANFTLTVGISGAASSGLGTAPSGDAKVKGTPYHATGPLPCRMGNDKPIECEFGVIRGKPGNAEAHITPPGGLKRVLTFKGNKVTTNPGEKIKAEKHGYDWSIEVNDYEHYTVPEAVISGG